MSFLGELMDDLCLNLECGGILISLANSPLKFAWIIGIYGKRIFLNFRDFQESLNPLKSKNVSEMQDSQTYVFIMTSEH